MKEAASVWLDDPAWPRVEAHLVAHNKPTTTIHRRIVRVLQREPWRSKTLGEISRDRHLLQREPNLGRASFRALVTALDAALNE